jgi:hypothetical protein
MNDEQLNQLFAAARQAPPETGRVELALETRLLARLREAQRPSALWSAWTWRLAPIFAAVVIGLGVWNYMAPAGNGAENAEETMVVALLTGGE